MHINEFTENIETILNHAIYYYGENNDNEAPICVKKLSDKSVMVEFSDPEDIFMVTVTRRDGKS